MSRRHNCWYLAVTPDDFELTLFCGDSYRELEEWIHSMGDVSSKKSLISSPTGEVLTDKGKFKLLRINSRSGKTIIGKLPKKGKRNVKKLSR